MFDKGEPEEFHVKIAKAPEEIKGLLEVGFDMSVRRTVYYSSRRGSESPKNLRVGGET